MVALNVDGLVSGLDTSTIISQLMQIERVPQTRLQTRKTDLNKVVDLYRQLNTRFQAIEKAAEDLSSAADWGLAKATTSNDKLATVTVAANAPESRISFRVTSLAQRHSIISTGFVADPDATGAFSAGFSVAGVAITDVGTGSLRDVAAAINASDAGVNATVVEKSPDQWVLQLTFEQTGAASAFTVSGTGLEALGTVDQIVTQGTDATVVVGETNPYTITSSTNTLTDFISGATISLKGKSATEVVEIDVTRNAEGLADKVSALVTSVNDALTLVRTNSTYNATTRTSGEFLGDQVATRLANSLVNAAISGVTGATTSPSAIGISVSRDGVMTFDREKFLAAYEADPAGVQRLFDGGSTGVTTDDGLAERLRLVTAAATETTTGAIASAIEARTSSIRTLDSQIAAWDNRLALREQALRRQFTGMETALSRAQSQSQWLAGQINSLAANNA